MVPQLYAISGTDSRCDFFFFFFVLLGAISIVSASVRPPVMDLATFDGSISIFSTDMSSSMSVTFVIAFVNSCSPHDNLSQCHPYRCNSPNL